MTDPHDTLRKALEAHDALTEAEGTTHWRRMWEDACTPDAIRALLAERDAMARDAERYRWLFPRTQAECDDMEVGNLPTRPQDEVLSSLASWYMSKETADAAIDAAMQEHPC